MLYDPAFQKLVEEIKECFQKNNLSRVSSVLNHFDDERYADDERDEIKEHEKDTGKWLDNGGW